MPLLRDLTNYSAPHLLIHMVRFLDDWVGENSAGSAFSRYHTSGVDDLAQAWSWQQHIACKW